MLKKGVWVLVVTLLIYVIATTVGSLKIGSTHYAVEQPDAGELELWHYQSSEDGTAIVNECIGRFERQHPDITVKAQIYQSDAYKTKLNVSMATREPPDIFATWAGGMLSEFSNAGMVLDLTEWMHRDDYYKRFLPKAIQAATHDGRILAVPVDELSIAVVFYNKQIFSELGLAPPRTWADMECVIETLREHGIIPFALANREKWPSSIYYMYFVDRLGGTPFFQTAVDSGNALFFRNPVFTEAGVFMQELASEGAFNPNHSLLDYGSGYSRPLLYRGEAAMELAPSWSLSMIMRENPNFYDEKLDFFPFPVMRENQNPHEQPLMGSLSDGFYSVSALCENPRKAFALLQVMIDDESVKRRMDKGILSPVNDMNSGDPKIRKLIGLLNSASSVQLWYDQSLPLELAALHKDLCGELLDMSVAPVEAATRFADAAAVYERYE